MTNKNLIAKAVTERDAAVAAIERVRAIHERDMVLRDYCSECSDFGSDQFPPGQMVEWPCPTIQALDGAPEPEWEYGLLNPQAPDGGKLQGGAHLISENREHIIAQQRKGHPVIQAVRRHKAGPWLPVEGEKP